MKMLNINGTVVNVVVKIVAVIAYDNTILILKPKQRSCVKGTTCVSLALQRCMLPTNCIYACYGIVSLVNARFTSGYGAFSPFIRT